MSRHIVATLHHKGKPVWNRRYARIDTAFPRAVELLIIDGEPGDVIEFSHSEYGFQIGTVKIKAGGKITINITPKE